MQIIENLPKYETYELIGCPEMYPKYLVIHNTANNASAENEISFMHRNAPINYTSYHYAVDDKVAIQGWREDKVAWHAGDGPYGPGNLYGIGIEICYSTNYSDNKYQLAEENCVELAAILCYRYWGTKTNIKDKITKHADYMNKNCPHRILDEGRWDSFVERVQDRFMEIKEISAKQRQIDKNLSDLTAKIDKLTSIISETQNDLKTVKKQPDTVYHKESEIPKWAYFTKRLIKIGKIKGDTKGDLNLSNEMVRIIEIMNR